MKKAIIWILLLLIILGAAAWFGIPALLETDWAKERVKATIERETGRKARVGGISFGWMSGLKVKDVVLQQKQEHPTEFGPLFSIDTLKIDVGFKELLDQQLNIKEILADEPIVTLVRFPDGTFNISDLMARPAQVGRESPTPQVPAPAGRKPSKPGGSGDDVAKRVTASFRLENARVLYIDQKLGTRLEMRDLDADADYNKGRLRIDSVFKLNEGAGVFKAHADLTQQPASFEVQVFEVNGSQLESNMAHLGLFMPLMGNKPEKASGELVFKLAGVKGTGLDVSQLSRTLSGSGELKLAGATMASGPIVQLTSVLQALGAGDIKALAGAGGAKQRLDMSLVTGSFRIDNGRIHTQDLGVKGSGMSLGLVGSTSLTGDLDYVIKVGGLEETLAKSTKLRQALGTRPDIPLKLTGNLTSPSVSVDPTSAISSALSGLLQEKLGGKLDEKMPGIKSALKKVGELGSKKNKKNN